MRLEVGSVRSVRSVPQGEELGLPSDLLYMRRGRDGG